MSKFIGQRLKQLRENAKLSVAELSTLIGKNRATVYRYENGEIEMPLELITPLAKALGVTPADVLGICEEDVLILTNVEKNLVKAYRSRPEMQKAVDTLLGILEEQG